MGSFADVNTEVEVEPLKGKAPLIGMIYTSDNCMRPARAINMSALFHIVWLCSARGSVRMIKHTNYVVFFQVYIMVSSPLQCWWLYWSLPCWQEQRGLRTRGTLYVFRGFPLLAVLITDKPAHSLQSRMEMCWSQTWGLTQDNSTRWLLFFFILFSPVLCLSLTISPSGT